MLSEWSASSRVCKLSRYGLWSQGRLTPIKDTFLNFGRELLKIRTGGLYVAI